MTTDPMAAIRAAMARQDALHADFTDQLAAFQRMLDEHRRALAALTAPASTPECPSGGPGPAPEGSGRPGAVTGPQAGTGRILSASEITDDQLDALYAELDTARSALDHPRPTDNPTA